jgi:thioredoxin-like negative regulator of GroEL
MEEQELREAKQALERGEYARVVRCLEPLLERCPETSPTGASLRLLLATALMGQGRSESAADYCRELRRCPDPTLRAQARDLLLVLEAPALQRPREWSLTMPDLPGTGPGGIPRQGQPVAPQATAATTAPCR